MRKATIVRLGVAAALATMGVAGAVGSGCTSSSNNPGVDGGGPGDGGTAGGDGGQTGPTDGSTGGQDANKPETGTPDSGPTPIPANLVIAHISPGIPPIRVCFATGTGTSLGVTPISALPETPSGAPPYPATGSFPAVTYGTPGIYPGTIGAFPTITDLQPITITPYAILASAIKDNINYDGGAGVNQADGGVEETCVQLIGTHGQGTTDNKPGRLTLNKEFFALSAIPAGTLRDNQTYLLTMNGCLPGGTAGSPTVPAQYTCGADYDGGVNVSIGIAQLDTATTVPDGGIGIQFAHRSTALENTTIAVTGVGVIHEPAAAGVWPTLIQPGVVGSTPNDGGTDDAGNPIDAGSSPVYGPVPALIGDAAAGPTKYSGNGLSATSVMPYHTTDPTTSAIGVVLQPLDGGAANYGQWPQGDLFALPLSAVDQLSSWAASTAKSPTGFVAGQSYVFVLVGDPAAQQLPNPDGGSGINPQWDGRGMHFVAFPNVFTPH